LFTPDRYNSSALSKNKIICFDPFLFIFFVFCESTFFRQRHGLREKDRSEMPVGVGERRFCEREPSAVKGSEMMRKGAECSEGERNDVKGSRVQ
jgi:hypothetical protein